MQDSQGGQSYSVKLYHIMYFVIIVRNLALVVLGIVSEFVETQKISLHVSGGRLVLPDLPVYLHC